jgi:hypothetical protein
MTPAIARAKPGVAAIGANRPIRPAFASRWTSRATTAAVPRAVIEASSHPVRAGSAMLAASCPNVRHCQPNAAPFAWARLRASSFVAPGLAPRITTSSAAARPSSHARARSSRRRPATDTTTVGVIARGYHASGRAWRDAGCVGAGAYGAQGPRSIAERGRSDEISAGRVRCKGEGRRIRSS